MKLGTAAPRLLALLSTIVAWAAQPVAGWQLVGNAYCSPFGTLLPRAAAEKLGIEGCKQACDAMSECNTFIYDEWKGHCNRYMQPTRPTKCDSNQNGWTYWKPKARDDWKQNCSERFQIPEAVPSRATEYNGIQLQDVCIESPGVHHVYAVGDWGGIVFQKNIPPVPADKRSKLFPNFHRKYVHGVDDRAQLLVAAQMRARATVAPPDYVLNAGDNFYWGGIKGKCGGPPVVSEAERSSQWEFIFENVYWGPGLEGKPWLGVLGNHDYGGYKFTSAWEKLVGYTWSKDGASTGRWFTPALYWAQTVKYTDLSVDYIFVDTNAVEAWAPNLNPTHNLCGLLHSGKDATCGEHGPKNVTDCPHWFLGLWREQFAWMVEKMEQSTATWLVVVTHFPPKWFNDPWSCLADRYGIDLFVSGHIHHQAVYSATDSGNWLKGSCTIVTGGGGGITSEGTPSRSGFDDMYGFVDIELTGQHITLKAISHGGVTRSVTTCSNRPQKRAGGKSCSPNFSPERRKLVSGNLSNIARLI